MLRPKASLPLRTCALVPWRTSVAPSGWNQCVTVVAPLAMPQSTSAAATASALVAGHAGSASSAALSPCRLRYCAPREEGGRVTSGLAQRTAGGAAGHDTEARARCRALSVGWPGQPGSAG